MLQPSVEQLRVKWRKLKEIAWRKKKKQQVNMFTNNNQTHLQIWKNKLNQIWH